MNPLFKYTKIFLCTVYVKEENIGFWERYCNSRQQIEKRQKCNFSSNHVRKKIDINKKFCKNIFEKKSKKEII